MKRLRIAALSISEEDLARLSAEFGETVTVTPLTEIAPTKWRDYDAVLVFSGNASGEISEALARSCVGHPHLRVIFGEKAEEVELNARNEIRALLSETECERKFLVTYPDVAALETSPFASSSHIVQTYLTAEEGVTERVRMRENFGRVIYTHTVKRRIDRTASEEHEGDIGEAEYLALLTRADPLRTPVDKVRWCILYEGQYLELDVYPFWSDRAVMELEYAVPTDEMPKVPPFFRVIREVTDDVRYKNVRLAENVPYDEIG